MLHEDQPARPWGTVTPVFWAPLEEETDEEAPDYAEPAAFASARTSPPATPPAEDIVRRFAELAAHLADPLTDAELALAALRAATLDQDITTLLGPGDRNVASVRELRGLIAGRQGHHATAARWHLHTAGLHTLTSGTDAPRSRSSAHHALAAWREIADHAERAVVAREILPMLTAVAGPTARPTREVQTYLAAQDSP
ncbi:hypothetical protein GCM10018790_77840 [Kitasatospora xanthocidica]|uniref:hypothetical protein n=1 Tax=Kitasatospora xanthocidica TaxID=83382 RepID=UPI001672C2D1|nr:hypothetical protein [Kitasatospora xanthocidica]GHF88914.1 hypothetical protein GCM10018790_77840 [Kitasatospora xanthocidica]